MTEFITVLRAAAGKRACKVFSPDGVRDYDAGTVFSFEECPVANLTALHELLSELEFIPGAFIIRGKPRSYIAPTAKVRRKSNGEEAAFEAKASRFVCVDVDKVIAPLGIDPTSPEAVEHIVSLLPLEFQQVSYIYQWSGSAGTAGADRKIKTHLWWQFQDPVTDREMRRWAECSDVADPKLYNPVQMHFTARPCFTGGVIDPFEDRPRTHLVQKTNDTVSFEPPPLASYAAPARSNGIDAVTDIDDKLSDRREDFLYRTRWKILRRGHVRSLAEFQKNVWIEFSSHAHLGRTAHSANFYNQAAVFESCGPDWDKHGKIVAAPPNGTLSPAEASEKLRATIHQALRRAVHLAIKGTAGLGKTVKTAEELVRIDGIERMHIEIYAPRKNAQADWTEYLVRASGTAGKTLLIQPIFGRSDENCIKYELAQRLAQKQLSVPLLLCNPTNGPKCAAFETCGYRAQFESSAPGIRVFNHSHLAVARPKGLSRPDIIIIDEAFHDGLCSISDLSINDFSQWVGFRTSDVIWSCTDHTKEIIAEVVQALRGSEPLLEELRSRGLSSHSLLACAEELQSFLEFPKIQADAPLAQTNRQLKQTRRGDGLAALRLLRALAAESETGRRESNSVKKTNDGKVRLCVRTASPRLEDVATILILDADHEAENVKPFLPSVETVTITARESKHVSQIEDLTMSKGYLGVRAGDEPNLDHVAALANYICRARGKNKLVITYKALVELLAPLLPGVVFGHFGAVRGSNSWESCDTAFVIGRHWVHNDDIEATTRALHFDSDEPLKFGEQIVRRHEVGLGVLQSRDEIDPRAQAVRCTTREAETRQAMARLRTVHCETLKRIFLLSSQPVGIQVDALVRFEPGKGERLFESLEGYLPYRAADLARVGGGEFASQIDAEKWRDRPENSPGVLKNTLERSGVVSVQTGYRAAGTRGPKSQVLVDPIAHPAPEVSLTVLLAAEIDPLPWRDEPLPGLPDCMASKSLAAPTSGKKVWLVFPRLRESI